MAKNESKRKHAPFVEDGIYHIFNRGINGCSIFSSDRNRDFFLSRMQRYILPYFDLFAWVLMDNHFHILVQVKSLNEAFLEEAKKENTLIGKQFLIDQAIDPFLVSQYKRWFNSYVKAYNKEQERSGSLLEKRFCRIRVDSFHYAQKLVDYIHYNPVEHGFAERPQDWQYSSTGTKKERFKVLTTA
ncbi:MAG: transposase [Bacteroidia bacterium]